LAELEIDTPHGPARAHLDEDPGRGGTLVLGHGAGGGVRTTDLDAAAAAAREAGLAVALVEQPYRVAGRRSPAPAGQLDTAWLAVIEELRGKVPAPDPLIVGGRSAGARVACRTAAQAGAAAVLCLAFPEHPPGKPEKSRQGELDAVEVPVLVVQGRSDPFGMPTAGEGREIVTVAGNHALKAEPDAVRSAVARWLVDRGF